MSEVLVLIDSADFDLSDVEESNFDGEGVHSYLPEVLSERFVKKMAAMMVGLLKQGKRLVEKMKT